MFLTFAVFLSLLACLFASSASAVAARRLMVNSKRTHKVWLYRDSGAGPGCVENTIATFSKLLSSDYDLQCVYAHHIKHTLPNLSSELLPKLIIFPGGGDIPYHNKLKGTGCQNIRQYVLNGGSYLGLCAGGYFGCNEIFFKFNDDELWSAKRELSFHDQLKCCGPILADYDSPSQKGVRVPLIKVPAMDNAKFRVYYHGGGHFYFADGCVPKQWSIMATYDVREPTGSGKGFVCSHLKNECALRLQKHIPHLNELVAVVHGKIGKGRVILTGVHPEIDSTKLDAESHPHLKPMIKVLAQENNNEKRLQLLELILHSLNISTREKLALSKL